MTDTLPSSEAKRLSEECIARINDVVVSWVGDDANSPSSRTWEGNSYLVALSEVINEEAKAMAKKNPKIALVMPIIARHYQKILLQAVKNTLEKKDGDQS